MVSRTEPDNAGRTTQAGTPFPGSETPETLVGYYRQMALIRRFELMADQMYKRAKIDGYCHLNLGEEASVVGLMAELEPRDYLLTNGKRKSHGKVADESHHA